MKITVLGTAAATGIPLAFCNCPVCRKARALGGKNIRKRSSIVINDDMLIDLGPDSMNSCCMYGVDAGRIRYLLQTHSHSDHFDAGHFVTRMSDYAVRSLEHLAIVCSEGTAKDMAHWVSQNEDIDLFSEYAQNDMNYSLVIIGHGESITLGDYEISAVDSRHDPRVEALNFIISQNGKTLFYATDLLELSEEAWRVIEKHRFDAVFLDCTYGEGYNAGGHIDAGTLREYASRMRKEGVIKPETPVYATHISHEGNGTHEEMEQIARQNGYAVAFDGMTVYI